MTLGEVAQRDFTIAREDDIAFDVIERMWRKGGAMAVVVAGKGVPTGADVRGIISRNISPTPSPTASRAMPEPLSGELAWPRRAAL